MNKKQKVWRIINRASGCIIIVDLVTLAVLINRCKKSK